MSTPTSDSNDSLGEANASDLEGAGLYHFVPRALFETHKEWQFVNENYIIATNQAKMKNLPLPAAPMTLADVEPYRICPKDANGNDMQLTFRVNMSPPALEQPVDTFFQDLLTITDDPVAKENLKKFNKVKKAVASYENVLKLLRRFNPESSKQQDRCEELLGVEHLNLSDDMIKKGNQYKIQTSEETVKMRMDFKEAISEAEVAIKDATLAFPNLGGKELLGHLLRALHDMPVLAALAEAKSALLRLSGASETNA